MRPFIAGDRASLLWGADKRGPAGVVLEILQLSERTPYAKVMLDNGQTMLYPVDRLRPSGWTQFTLRHFLFSTVEFFKMP